MQLEKTFRNGIIEAAQKGGIEPRDCIFDFDDDGGCRITHTPSGSSFVIEGPFGHFTTTAIVGDNPPRQIEAFSWRTVEEQGGRWARGVKEDVDTPDLWAELQLERAIVTGARFEDVENTPFSADEQVVIAEQLQQTQEWVTRTYSLPEAQILQLEAKLDDIAAAAGRMGRKDWTLLVCGAMFGPLVQGILPPDAVHDILRMTLDGLGYPHRQRR